MALGGGTPIISDPPVLSNILKFRIFVLKKYSYMGCFEPSRLLIKGRLRDKDAFIMESTPGRCTVLTPRRNDPCVPEIQQLAQTLRPFESQLS